MWSMARALDNITKAPIANYMLMVWTTLKINRHFYSCSSSSWLPTLHKLQNIAKPKFFIFKYCDYI